MPHRVPSSLMEGDKQPNCPNSQTCMECCPCMCCIFFGNLAVWPDWAIYWTLGNFLKPLAAINLLKIFRIIRQFCKGAKILNFSSEIILDNFYRLLATFYWSHWNSGSYGLSYKTAYIQPSPFTYELYGLPITSPKFLSHNFRSGLVPIPISC